MDVPLRRGKMHKDGPEYAFASALYKHCKTGMAPLCPENCIATKFMGVVLHTDPERVCRALQKEHGEGRGKAVRFRRRGELGGAASKALKGLESKFRLWCREAGNIELPMEWVTGQYSKVGRAAAMARYDAATRTITALKEAERDEWRRGRVTRDAAAQQPAPAAPTVPATPVEAQFEETDSDSDSDRTVLEPDSTATVNRTNLLNMPKAIAHLKQREANVRDRKDALAMEESAVKLRLREIEREKQGAQARLQDIQAARSHGLKSEELEIKSLKREFETAIESQLRIVKQRFNLCREIEKDCVEKEDVPGMKTAKTIVQEHETDIIALLDSKAALAATSKL
jgi:hypothetical protein